MSQSLSLLGILAVLSASGACSAPTEVERRCHDNEENSRSMFSEILAGTAVKASGTGAKQTGVERRLLQQAENRFRVTKALLAEEWVLKKSFKIRKNFGLILFVS